MHKGLIQAGSGKPQADMQLQVSELLASLGGRGRAHPSGGRAMGPLGEWMRVLGRSPTARPRRLGVEDCQEKHR